MLTATAINAEIALNRTTLELKLGSKTVTDAFTVALNRTTLELKQAKGITLNTDSVSQSNHTGIETGG